VVERTAEDPARLRKGARMAGDVSGHRIPVGWAVAVVAVLAFVNVGAGTWRRFRIPGWLEGPPVEGASAWASLIPPAGWTPEPTAALARQPAD
jgi:hypothetical protein